MKASRSALEALDTFRGLVRPGPSLLIAAAAAFGQVLALRVSGLPLDIPGLISLSALVFVSAGGCFVFNQVHERESDARMARTRGRPVPSGRIHPVVATWLGGLLLSRLALRSFEVDRFLGVSRGRGSRTGGSYGS